MKKGGCTNACVCMGTHSQPLLQKRLLVFMKFGRDVVLMALHMQLDVSAISNQGLIQVRPKLVKGWVGWGYLSYNGSAHCNQVSDECP